MNTKHQSPDTQRMRTRNLVLCGMLTVLIVICSYITIPFVVPITLQTFAIAFLLLLVGGKRGLICITLYLLLGACGIPVFHGMTGGPGILLGSTGGYLFGFLAMGLVYMLLTLGEKVPLWRKSIGLVAGLFSCYLIGTLWFAFFYIEGTVSSAIAEILVTCVIPFIIPDLIKISLAIFFTKIVKKALPKN